MARDVARVWTDGSGLARAARTAMRPLSAAYGAAIALRNWAYDGRLLRSEAPALPALSIGNLTVGGTGKTPIAAWVAAELVSRGARPAILLRGYQRRGAGGDADSQADEAAVHRALNPLVPVIVDADRLAATARAAGEGCDVVVLDDAFQHRRVQRVADLVLVSADAWAAPQHVLPAGPWREPLGNIRRATVAIVTRKDASDAAVDSVMQAIARVAPTLPLAVAHLAPQALRLLDGTTLPLDALRAQPVFAVAGVGDPDAFFAQLRALTPQLATARYPDHHRFTAADARSIARAAEARFPGGYRLVGTLKDAVKLAALCPVLWYLTQRVVWERGGEIVSAALDTVFRVRPGRTTS